MATTIALDIGTTKICGVVVDPAGAIDAVAQRANDAAVPGLPARFAEQSPARIWELVCAVLRDLSSPLKKGTGSEANPFRDGKKALRRGACPLFQRTLSRRAPDVAALGLTGQMHGMLCVDAGSRPPGHEPYELRNP
jgi:sugar (pentulose or hexulose) kinase